MSGEPMAFLSDVAHCAGGELRGDDARFSGVSTDTRTLADGDLYVALSGDRHDGHAYLAQALARGAAGAVVSRRVDSPLPQVQVGDTLAALQGYAAHWRMAFDVPVIGVTGSNGKTTVKQMLAAELALLGPVLATAGNLNNHIGVPLTLLRLRDGDRAAVIEMGANHAGEIEALAQIARPRIGVVTNAGDAHLEGFGSREGVARAKGELFAQLPAHGIACINLDDAFAPLWRETAAHCGQITFGFDEAAEVRAASWTPTATGSRFELRALGERALVDLPLPGRHNVVNALAAAAVGAALGLPASDIAAGLSQVQGAPGRLSWTQTAQGARLLDDTYNANPSSLRAGLELLAQAAPESWLVLGDMAELGGASAQLHEQAGQVARELGVARLYATGELSRHAVRGFGDGARHYADVDLLVDALRAQLQSQPPGNVAMLVKGSRSARMERVVAALTGTGPLEAAH